MYLFGLKVFEEASKAPSSDFIVDSWRCNGVGPGCLSAFGGAGGGEKTAISIAKCMVGREEFL